MKFDICNPEIRRYLFEGAFGLEKESLRIDRTSGRFARTAHPFSNPCIGLDFAENQTEINTEVFDSWQKARARCQQLTIAMLRKLDAMDEVLWPFSNPCRIDSPDEIPILSSGPQSAIDYRRYLDARYGKMKMAFSGIHYNFSFSKTLLLAQYRLDQSSLPFDAWKDRFYLDLVARYVRHGWLIGVLLNASPVFDGSLILEEDAGISGFAGMSSMRNSQFGYWNFFTPHFDYSDMSAYTASIRRYVDAGLLIAPSELYYPVRLKPEGKYSLEALEEKGASHIELRNIDLNPYELSGISQDDAWFCHLFLVWLACLDEKPLSWKEQIESEQNFKTASRYDLDRTRLLIEGQPGITVRQAACQLLEAMKQFYENAGFPAESALIERQMDKLCDHCGKRLAARVRADFGDFDHMALPQALALQKQALDRSMDEFIVPMESV